MTDHWAFGSPCRLAPCARVICTYNRRVAKDSRVYVRASEQDQHVFRAVAEALGQGTMSAALRLVMWEKYRALGLDQPTRAKKGKR